MTIDGELTLSGKRRQQLLFEALSGVRVKGVLRQHEEPGVDPVILEHRLLDEAAHPTGCVDVNGAVLGRQRHRGHRALCRAGVMPCQQLPQVDIAETIAVRREELPAQEASTTPDALGGAGLAAGVDDLDLPGRRDGLSEVAEYIDQVATREDETGEALSCVDRHDVLEDRPVTDRKHGLRQVQRERVCARPLPTTEDQRCNLGTCAIHGGRVPEPAAANGLATRQ